MVRWRSAAGATAARSPAKTDVSQRCRFIGRSWSNGGDRSIALEALAALSHTATNHMTAIMSMVKARRASHLSARVAAIGSHRTAAGWNYFPV